MNGHRMFVIALLVLLGLTFYLPVVIGDLDMALAQQQQCCPCPVAPLTPLTDQAAINMENGNRIDRTGLTPAMVAALACFETSVQHAGGTFDLNSAYRPPQYQNHLREIWDKRRELRRVRGAQRRQACAALRQQVEAEFQNHTLLATQRPAAAGGPHTQGLAIDVGIRNMGIPVNQVLQLATNCQLQRPFPVADPVHFQRQ